RLRPHSHLFAVQYMYNVAGMSLDAEGKFTFFRRSSFRDSGRRHLAGLYLLGKEDILTAHE
ncbi:unnamed protein product, partial [Amoebophrya sp. A25]